ncbi:MAG: hypothetical protein ACYC4L_00210 [Chloroflexota bacterium]
MEIDRGSFLLGMVMGLALAAIVIGGAIVLAPRGQPAGATAALSPTRSIATPTPDTPTPTATATPQPSPTPTTPPAPTATPVRPTPTPSDTPRFENLEVPPRRSVQLSIVASAGQTLELALMVDSDIDLTITDPTGTVVYGPQRVRRSYTSQLQSPAGGNFLLKLDNSFSIISTKQVLVQYRLLPPRP